MRYYEVYGKVYDTVADYRQRNYHYAVRFIEAIDSAQAEAIFSHQFFSASIVSIREVSR